MRLDWMHQHPGGGSLWYGAERPRDRVPLRRERKAAEKVRKTGKENLKESCKRGGVTVTKYAPVHLRSSDERLMTDNVELGHVDGRHDNIARA